MWVGPHTGRGSPDQGGVKISPSIWIYIKTARAHGLKPSQFVSILIQIQPFTSTSQTLINCDMTYIQIMEQPVVHFVILMSDLPWQQKKIKEHMHSLTALFEMMWKFNQGSHDFKSSCNTHVSLLYPRSDKSVYTLKSCYFWGRCSKIFQNMHENCVISHFDNLDHYFDF